MSSDKEAEKLSKWMIEMGLVTCTVDNEELLTQCRRVVSPQLKYAWNHVIEHVRPVSEASYIRRVLLLHKLQQQQEQLDDQTFCNDVPSINDVKQLELIRKYKLLTGKLRGIEENVCKHMERISTLLAVLKKNMRIFYSGYSCEKTGRKEFFDTLVGRKIHVVQKQLHSSIEWLQRLKDALADIKNIGSSDGEGYTQMIVEDCVNDVEGYVKNTLLPAMCTTSSDNADSSFAATSMPLEYFEDTISNKCNRSVPLNDAVQILINSLKNTLEKLRQFQNEFYDGIDNENPSNSGIKERIPVGASLQQKLSDGKPLQIRLYLQVQQHNQCIRQLLNEIKEKITSAQFPLQCAADVPDYRLFAVALSRKIYFDSLNNYITNAGSTRRSDKYSLSGSSDNIGSLCRNFKESLREDYKSLLYVGEQINVGSKVICNMHRRMEDGQVGVGELTLLNSKHEEARNYSEALHDCVIKEFSQVFQIPYDAFLMCSLQSIGDCNLEHSLISLFRLCCSLYTLLACYSTHHVNPEFDANSLKNRIKEVSESEYQFHDTLQAKLATVHQNAITVDTNVEHCNNVLSLWKNLATLGSYIPSHILVEGNTFTQWFSEADAIVKLIQQKTQL